MSKQNWVVFSLTLLISLFFGVDQVAITAETKAHEFTTRCEAVDEKMEDDIAYILEILKAEDFDALTDRVNELVASTELLEDEKNVMEATVCLEEVVDDSILTGTVNGYHSLLVYAIQKKEEEDVQFEEITYTRFKEDMYLQVEGILKNNDEKVTIDHYYSSTRAGDSYLARELRLSKERLKEAEEMSSPFLTIVQGLAASSHVVLQNPIEKFMMFVDSIFIDKSEKEQELFEREESLYASVYNMRFSLITVKKSTWEQLNMTEYYPTKSTYYMLERAEQVRKELPDYWYPKEEIENGDWNGIVSYYEKHRKEMIDYDAELYDYIVADRYRESENFEELIKKVKEENGVRD